MSEMLCPCTYCSRVPNPNNCDNKKCVPWQRWFLRKWEHTRNLFRVPYDHSPLQEAGVPLGGHRYSHPHRVREYLESLGRFDEILETTAGAVISSHCGPGTLGVLFIAQ